MLNFIKRLLRKVRGAWKITAYLIIAFAVILGLALAAVRLYGRTTAAAEERNSAYMLLNDAKVRLEDRNSAEYVKQLEDAFTEEQLTALTERFVTYEILVNNKKIGENQTIFYSQTPKIVITFYEKFNRDALKFFPKEFLYKYSKIPADVLADKIIVSTTKSEYEMSEMISDERIRTDLVFDKVVSGEIITLDLEYRFSKLLGLTDSSLEIFYNVTTGGQ